MEREVIQGLYGVIQLLYKQIQGQVTGSRV